MSCMSCDDVSGGMNWEMSVSELAKLLKAYSADCKLQAAPAKASKVEAQADDNKPPEVLGERVHGKWAVYLTRVPPSAPSEVTGRLKVPGLVDLYAERIQREKQGLQSLHGDELARQESADAAVSDNDVLDLYQERLNRRRRK